MRRPGEIFKTLIVAIALAFASTVSAVHVHDIIVCSSSPNAVVQNMPDLHDCVFCWVVYQTVTVESDFNRISFSVLETAPQYRPIPPLSNNYSHWLGRAPPLSA